MKKRFEEDPFKEYPLEMLEQFKRLPDRAQHLIFSYLAYAPTEHSPYYFHCAASFDTDDLQSPIEKILFVASQIYAYEYGEYMVEPYPQYKIQCGDKTYRVDFMYDNSESRENSGYDNKPYPYKDVRIVVECDGHDFHQKSKMQVKRDNERQIALQLAGYDVVRFSGSQIYENPMMCAKKIFDLAKTKMAGDSCAK